MPVRFDIPGPRMLAAVFALMLSVVLLVSSSSKIPTVSIDQLSSLDGGSEVRLVGVVVGLSLNEGGSEDVIIADVQQGTTVKIICMSGTRPLPSRYISIGDEVSLTGATADSSPNVVFTTSDDIVVTRGSESTLTVGILASNWLLFEGDSFTVGGVLIERDRGSFALSDLDGLHTIRVVFAGELSGYVGKNVLVTAQLRLDSATMALVLSASSVVPRLAQ